MKTYTMNYENPVSVMKDFLWGVYRPTAGTGNPQEGDVILLTSKEDNFAVGMVGRVTEVDIDFDKYDIDVPVYAVDWNNGPVEIEPTFTCVQGGHITLQDRAHVLAQLV